MSYYLVKIYYHFTMCEYKRSYIVVLSAYITGDSGNGRHAWCNVSRSSVTYLFFRVLGAVTCISFTTLLPGPRGHEAKKIVSMWMQLGVFPLVMYQFFLNYFLSFSTWVLQCQCTLYEVKRLYLLLLLYSYVNESKL